MTETHCTSPKESVPVLVQKKIGCVYVCVWGGYISPPKSNNPFTVRKSDRPKNTYRDTVGTAVLAVKIRPLYLHAD